MYRENICPSEFSLLRSEVLKKIHPITSIDDIAPSFSKRTHAGRELPSYFICYFLLVELLEFKYFGRYEKIAWSIPILYKDHIFSIEHRKLGLGLFAHSIEDRENEAAEIVKLINKGANKAKPYFESIAQKAVLTSELNVVNHHQILYSRFQFFLKKYKDSKTNHDLSKSKQKLSTKQESEWLALATLDAFFSWTEHIFIHFAILNCKITTGIDAADLFDNEWHEKFKIALNIKNSHIKSFFDQLIEIKRNLRNYLTHGAFGKKGEAFSFHSIIGAIPVYLHYQRNSDRFSIQDNLSFNDSFVIDLIEKFISFLWNEECIEKKYIESGLPLILSFTCDGKYSDAMQSEKDMNELIDYLECIFDQSANMDW